MSRTISKWRYWILLLALPATCLRQGRQVPVNGDATSDGTNSGDAATSEDGSMNDGPVSLLVFTKTVGFRHSSIDDGVAAVQRIAQGRGWQVEHTEDSTRFDDARLAPFAAVIWLNTTGDVLNAEQQAAFERFIRAGRGYVGVHSATDTEYDWQWYGDLVGAYFSGHPNIQPATLRVEDRTHPSTGHLSETWQRNDEWYNFRANPRSKVHVLLSLVESSYQGGNMGDHPAAWFHEFDGGRAFYTAGGHTDESYTEPAFVEHLAGGIAWAIAPP